MRLRSMLESAMADGYAVAACNVFDFGSMDAVLAAARGLDSPVIVQVSVRTARIWGPRRIGRVFDAMRAERGVAAVLHLDHCTDEDLVIECMDAGWDSALFDTSGMDMERAVTLTRGLVKRGSSRGFDVEGEIQPINSAVGGVAPNVVTDIEGSVSFVERTGVACFSPAIGTVHGVTPDALSLDWEGLGKLAGLLRLPLVLHGGSGVDAAVVRRLIRRGIAKVNYSSVLKTAFGSVLDQHTHAPFVEPLAFAQRAHDSIVATVRQCIRTVESGGRVCARAGDDVALP